MNNNFDPNDLELIDDDETLEYVTETYEESIERAMEIAEDEGRPFDHVMGEILGGIR